jgi:transposase
MAKVARKVWEGKRKMCVKTGDRVFVGLDVHKASVHAALMINGVIVKTWSMPYNPAVIAASLEPYRAARCGVVYEAGPTGFSLARRLIALGYVVKVAAPSRIPRPSAPQAKSDRLDCRRLADFLAKGQLTFVTIPTETEEADRQVMRSRGQCLGKVKRAKQQIKSFLLQHGIVEPDGLAYWSNASLQALKDLKLNAQLRFCLDRLLRELAFLCAELKAFEEHLGRLARTERLRKAIRILDAHPGVGPLTAMAFAVEVYRPERFTQGKGIAGYTGLAPKVSQSGLTRREGPLMKTGRGELRALLVEASWRWVSKDTHGRQLFAHLVRNTGSKQKAIVGVARHLSIELWKRLVQAA